MKLSERAKLNLLKVGDLIHAISLMVEIFVYAKLMLIVAPQCFFMLLNFRVSERDFLEFFITASFKFSRFVLAIQIVLFY